MQKFCLKLCLCQGIIYRYDLQTNKRCSGVKILLYVILAVMAGASKGSCGKKVSGYVNSISDSVAMNIQPHPLL